MSYEEQIMPKDKYPSIFSTQMEGSGVQCLLITIKDFAKSIRNVKIEFFTCHGCKPERHFLPSCSEVNSTGYSECDKPISARLQRYPLF